MPLREMSKTCIFSPAFWKVISTWDFIDIESFKGLSLSLFTSINREVVNLARLCASQLAL